MLPLLGAYIAEGAMRLLGTLISRQREVLADATAVEMTRNPLALAKVIYRAQLKYSVLGSFPSTYSALFLVAPEAEGLSHTEGLVADLFSTHPPVMMRLKLLADMAHTTVDDIIRMVWEEDVEREKARVELHSLEEARHAGKAKRTAGSRPALTKEWQMRRPDGEWGGLLSLAEMMSLPHFTGGTVVRNLTDGRESPANKVEEIMDRLRGKSSKRAEGATVTDPCPTCTKPLALVDYEGVEARVCRECGGRLVKRDDVQKILIRQEVAFSPSLTLKAKEYKRKMQINPMKLKKRPGLDRRLVCPRCGILMLARPYNYQYFIPVEECLRCGSIWFDADELEILQIVVGER